MLNQVVNRDFSTDTWNYSPTKYWPTAGQKLSFFAITPNPATEPSVSFVADSYGSYLGYPSFMVTPPATYSQQKDIGVASALNQRIDDADGNKVDLTFNHAMHKVGFTGQYSGTIPDAGTMKVKQLWLNNVAGSGKLNISPPGFYWSDIAYGSPATYFLSAREGDMTGSLLPQQSTATSADISSEQGTLLLVPQTVSTATVQAVGTFSINGTDRDYEIVPMGTLGQSTWEGGKSTVYNLIFNVDGKGYPFSESGTNVWVFDYAYDVVSKGATDGNDLYRGKAQEFTAPEDGFYRLEAWGARGGTPSTADSNQGGYCKGTIFLKKDQKIYIYVGQRGHYYSMKSGVYYYTDYAFNGGGRGGLAETTLKGGRGGSGGGATDFRLVNASDPAKWDDPLSLNSRILVAAGGGGYASYNTKSGGYGGGLTGGNGQGSGVAANSHGGDQTGANNNKSLSYGKFGEGASTPSSTGVGGGGGGWYGGDSNTFVTGTSANFGSGSGGSSFISGMLGCVAINPGSQSAPACRTLPQERNLRGCSITATPNSAVVLPGRMVRRSSSPIAR
jgi:hypothetical protein